MFSNVIEWLETEASRIGKEKKPNAKYRAAAYRNVISKITDKFPPNTPVTETRIDSLPITDFMKDKAKQFINSGPLETSQTSTTQTKSSKSSSAMLEQDLVRIPGIGTERARQLIQDGIKHVNQLHMKKWQEKLTEESKVFLALKPSREIPYQEARKLEPLIKRMETKNRKLYIVGSYRRKKPLLRDLDVMLVSDQPNALDLFLEDLKQQHKEIYPYSKGTDKMSFLIGQGKKYYKMDIFTVTPEDKIPMLLYSTGSKEHNILMRAKAKKLGYKLNQKGLFQGEKKVSNLLTEKDYFDALQMDYLEPEQR